jgi:hypothetical protein
VRISRIRLSDKTPRPSFACDTLGSCWVKALAVALSSGSLSYRGGFELATQNPEQSDAIS